MRNLALPGVSYTADSDNMDISVIICTYNRAESLKRTLASLAAVTAPIEWEILVVDNNSTDGTRAATEQFAASSGLDVRYLFEPTQGKSFALNTGIREAQGKILAFTDDDVTFDAEWMMALKAIIDETGCMGVSGKIVPVWDCTAPAWFDLEGQQAVGHFDMGDAPRETNYAHGANAAFRKEAFEKYGGFRADLGPDGKSSAGYEDDEFGRRLTRHGEKIIYAPRAVVYHPVEPHKLTKAYFRQWFYNMNRAAMWARIWPEETKLYFGIPRYLFRAAVENALLCALTPDPKRRFRRECLARGALGGIVEGFRMIRAKKK